MSRKTDKAKPTTCRLEPEYREALEGRAAELKMTMSDLVRKYVMDGLAEESAKVTLHEELPVIREEIKQLRRDLSLIAEVLLSRAGQLEPDRARKWASENIGAK